MFEETAYIPFQTGHLPRGSWLVLAPHADDETFGMGGAILMAARKGQDVDVLIMTDGARGGNKTDLIHIRENEARAATQALGCRHVDFMNQPDRSLPISQILIDEVSRHMADRDYAAVFFPSPIEPHPDHRATAQLAWEALRKTGFKSQPISYEISLQGPCNTLIDISSVKDEKCSIMRLYASQLDQNNYIDRIIGLNAARTWSLPKEVTHAEAFYRWDREDRPLATILCEIQSQRTSSKALPPPLEKVSVIVRTMRRPEMLREAIRSIAAQEYPHIELLVVNDGEEDLLQLVQEEATKSITSFKYLKNDDKRGRSRAANIGLQHATGRYIGFLDDDDWILPNHIKLLVSALENDNSAPAAYSGVDCVSIINGEETVLHQFNDSFDHIRLAFNNFMPIHSVLFRSSIRDEGYHFNEKLDMYEDWNFWLQIAQKGDFIHVNGVTAKYRMTEGSGSGLPTPRDDITTALDNFVNASRMTWSTRQLRHLCLYSHQKFLESQKRTQEHEQKNAKHQEQASTPDNLDIDSDFRAHEGNNHAEIIDDLRSRLKDHEEYLGALKRSLSWRLTKPLRAAKSLTKIVARKTSK
ncbi:MAG: glycosyltransferase [Pseudomonadota bacterium]